MRFIATLLAGLLMLAAPKAGAAGFQSAAVPDPADKPLAVGIWYPSAAPVSAQPNTPFRQALGLDAPIAGSRLPLVVISHGAGGWLGSQADTALALAEAGFVVVAVTHTGDNREDESYPASRWMVDRPRHVSRVLDYMLAEWPGHARIDPNRIGIFGFSAGAYTALVAIGGRPDLKMASDHCAKEPAELVCRLGMASDFATPEVARRPATVWAHDDRIKAAVIGAVGFGFAFDREGLAEVKIPVQLWAASDDRNVPYASNTAKVLKALPTPPDFHMVQGAGHFAFLPPCNPKLEAALPKVWAMVCVDAPGFDRAAFHRRLNKVVIEFFRRHLPAPGQT
jgi:predicted dienelactone hydrolase